MCVILTPYIHLIYQATASIYPLQLWKSYHRPTEHICRAVMFFLNNRTFILGGNAEDDELKQIHSELSWCQSDVSDL